MTIAGYAMDSILLALGGLAGLVACGLGSVAMAFPAKMSEGFGIKVEGSASAYVVGLGSRDVFVGGCFLAGYFLQNIAVLSVIGFLVAFVASSDFYIVFRYGEMKTAITHLLGFLAGLVYGVACLSHSQGWI